MTVARRPPPIAILSFDRPDYLAQVLDSLVAQQGGRLDDREIVLFQDGAFNPLSRVQRAAGRDIDACVGVFRAKLPGRRIERSAINLGVALSFERAERYMFEDRGVEAAVFLEDDMVLAPRYLRVLDRLLDIALCCERIGTVAAYGSHSVGLAAQRLRAAHYIEMEHNWAFGLPRRQWLRSKPYVDEYLALIRRVDYRDRPHREIAMLHRSWGFEPPGSSQDVTKGLACVATAAARVTTAIVLGRYIGAMGVHMTPAAFARQNFAATEFYDGPMPDFVRPSGAELERIMAVQQRWARPTPPGTAAA